MAEKFITLDLGKNMQDENPKNPEEGKDLETVKARIEAEKKVDDAVADLTTQKVRIHPPGPASDPGIEKKLENLEQMAHGGGESDGAVKPPEPEGPGIFARTYTKYRAWMDNADARMRTGSRKAFSKTGSFVAAKTRRSREWIYVHKPDWMHAPDFSEVDWRRTSKLALIGAGSAAATFALLYGAATIYVRQSAHNERRAQVSREAGREKPMLRRATEQERSPAGGYTTHTRAPVTGTYGAPLTDTALTDTALTDTALTDTGFTGTAPVGAAPATSTAPVREHATDTTGTAMSEMKPDAAPAAPPASTAPPPPASTAPAAAPPTAPPAPAVTRTVPPSTPDARDHALESIAETAPASRAGSSQYRSGAGPYLRNPVAIITHDGVEQRITLSTRQKGLPRVSEPYTLDNTLRGTALLVGGVMATELDGEWSKHTVTTVYLKGDDRFTLGLPQDDRKITASLSPTFNTAEHIAQARSIDGELTISARELKQDTTFVYDVALRDDDGRILQSVKVPYRFIIGSPAPAASAPEPAPAAPGYQGHKSPALEQAHQVPEHAPAPTYERAPVPAPLEEAAPAPSPSPSPIAEEEPVSYNAPGEDPAWDIPSTAPEPLDEILYTEPQKPQASSSQTSAYSSTPTSEAAASTTAAPSATFDYGMSAASGSDYALSAKEKDLVQGAVTILEHCNTQSLSREQKVACIDDWIDSMRDAHEFCDKGNDCGTPEGYDREQIMRLGRLKAAVKRDDDAVAQSIMKEYMFANEAMLKGQTGKDAQFDY